MNVWQDADSDLANFVHVAVQWLLVKNAMKRILTIVLLLLILPLPTLAEAPDAVGGDLNGDGLVGAADAALVLRAADGLMTLDGARSVAADVTGSMSINDADAAAILLHATGRLSSFSDLAGKLSGALLGERYADRFSYQGTIMTGTGYRSDMVSVSQRIIRRDESVCYVMDIYVRDITSFRTAFSSGKYRGTRESVLDMAESNEAIIAINGDFYSYRGEGPVVRNGVWYKESVDERMDICVLYRDGRLVTFEKGATLEQIQAEGEAYQSWAFGPMLLDAQGRAMTEFHCNKTILTTNPRAAIGYYEPGHYCFVLVDGRQSKYSKGMTMQQLSQLFEDLGCMAAYNLDGGQTAVMASKQGLVNRPFDGGRTTSDIVYIGEPAESAEVVS